MLSYRCGPLLLQIVGMEGKEGREQEKQVAPTAEMQG